MSDGDDKVVYLKFRTEKAEIDTAVCYIACANCRNKTYTILDGGGSKFPLVRCAACGTDIGRIGWASDE